MDRCLMLDTSLKGNRFFDQFNFAERYSWVFNRTIETQQAVVASAWLDEEVQLGTANDVVSTAQEEDGLRTCFSSVSSHCI